jgi:uncharacterized protein
MWTKLAHIIIKFRVALIVFLAIVTAYMGYRAQEIELAYDNAKVVPNNDPDMIYFEKFKSMFGEDGNMLVLGIKDSAIFEPENFRRFKYLGDALAELEGVDNVLALPFLQRMEKNSEEKKFDLKPVFEEIPEDKQALDSLLQQALDLKIYTGQLLNRENGATVMAITINKKILDTQKRLVAVNDIIHLTDEFVKHTGIKVHYAGLPYVRTVMGVKIKNELNLFLVLSVVVTAIILFAFFRDWRAVLFPLLVIGTMVIWVMGTLAIFGFNITLLTGLIPPIIVVIGIPNCIYLLNKYHQEYTKHGNKMRALSRIIRNVGLVTLITNFTTAIGFLVLAFTQITILREFGIVAGINILATFIVSIVLIPATFSFLPPPSGKQLKHLDFKFIRKMLEVFNVLIHRHSYTVFAITGIMLVVSAYGLSKVNAVSFMVDDIPEESQIKQDLYFFEENFAGVMPLEIVINTGKKNGVTNLATLNRVDRLEQYLSEQEYISQPLSLVSFVKATTQAFYNNHPSFYKLPNSRDRMMIMPYLDGEDAGLMKSFVDSTGQKMRVSLKIADIGSEKLDSMVNQVIQPKISEILGDKVEATVTGTTLLFLKGNTFLIENLKTSLAMAFGIIAIIMALLFNNVRMIIISLIPNVIPLLITGALMGYFGIALKPSTVLVFSIAFGISVDDSIHFLAKYRQELFNNNFFVPIALTKSLRETGSSMMYTSIVLFFGFIIFAGSDFGGTVALGLLTSVTLLIAMFTNLILLPALLFTFDDGKRKRDKHPLIEHYPEFYEEDEDEEIDLDLIRVEKSEEKNV